jgi:small subunit ribosomal protein S6
MRRYELVVIISPQVAEEEVPEAVERLVRRPVEGQGGVCDEVSVWGRRKLAYPISSHAEGNYVVTQLQLDPTKARELEQGLRISEEVLRHLLVRLDEA